MINIMISFTVKIESVEKVKEIIKQFIFSIHKNEPDILVYKSFQQKDKPERFIHIMTFANETVQTNHGHSKHCKEFVDRLYPLCVETPKTFLYDEIKN